MINLPGLIVWVFAGLISLWAVCLLLVANDILHELRNIKSLLIDKEADWWRK